MANGDCPTGAKNMEAISGLQHKCSDQDERMDKIDILLDKVRGRPTWSVTVIITLLSTACGILAKVVIG